MVLVVRERLDVCSAKSTRLHGSDMVICSIVSGGQRTPLIRAYLSPSSLNYLPYLEEAINIFLGRYPIIVGYLNADIGRLQNPRRQQVEDFLDSFSLANLLSHFRQRLRF